MDRNKDIVKKGIGYNRNKSKPSIATSRNKPVHVMTIGWIQKNSISHVDTGYNIMSWTINCGSAGSFNVDCQTGNDAGYEDGGSFQLQGTSTTCTTTTDSCNQVA